MGGAVGVGGGGDPGEEEGVGLGIRGKKRGEERNGESGCRAPPGQDWCHVARPGWRGPRDDCWPGVPTWGRGVGSPWVAGRWAMGSSAHFFVRTGGVGGGTLGEGGAVWFCFFGEVIVGGRAVSGKRFKHGSSTAGVEFKKFI